MCDIRKRTRQEREREKDPRKFTARERNCKIPGLPPSLAFPLSLFPSVSLLNEPEAEKKRDWKNGYKERERSLRSRVGGKGSQRDPGSKTVRRGTVREGIMKRMTLEERETEGEQRPQQTCERFG